MEVQAEAFFVPKEGNLWSEYEDAACVAPSVVNSSFRCGVSDGATESSFAGVWAKLLARAFVRGGDLSSEIARARRTWSRIAGKKPLPWYAEQKRDYGAFASILGLSVNGLENGAEEGVWEAVAVGDSCLVHARADMLLSSFPIRTSSEFNSRPILLGSNFNGCMVETQSDWGFWRRGDSFLLLTDAIACWLLKSLEDGGNPFQRLVSIKHQFDFEDFVASERDLHKRDVGVGIKNDDVTLLICQLM